MRCWVKATLGLGDECDGRIDPAHIGFTHQYLKQKGLGEEDRWDSRIIRAVCRKHHHALDNHFLRLTRAQLGPDVERYAEQHNLTARLDRDFGPRG